MAGMAIEMLWGAVLIGAVAQFVIGMIWYTPQVFGNKWMELLNFSAEQMQADMDEGKFNMKLTMSIQFIAGLVVAFVTMHIVQYTMVATDTSGIVAGITAAFWCWLGFIATDIGQYGFEQRTWKIYIIDKGWPLLAILVNGALVGHFAAL